MCVFVSMLEHLDVVACTVLKASLLSTSNSLSPVQYIQFLTGLPASFQTASRCLPGFSVSSRVISVKNIKSPGTCVSLFSVRQPRKDPAVRSGLHRTHVHLDPASGLHPAAGLFLSQHFLGLKSYEVKPRLCKNVFKDFIASRLYKKM